MEEQTEYEIQKQINKQKLIRNEFLNEKDSIGKFEFPILKNQNIDINKIDDPYKENKIEKCDVCGKIVLVDQYGNGNNCKNCRWIQSTLNEHNPDTVLYPNTISLNKAKSLYSQGKQLKPNFEDFIEGLKMYSEMSFEYNYKNYGVFYDEKHQIIEFFQDKVPESLQKYNSINEFIEKSNIDGKLLKDIWEKVKNADYMQG